MDSLSPRFAIEAHLANVFAEEAATQAGQYLTQEDEASRELRGQAEMEVPMQLPVALSQEDRQALCQHNEEHYDWLEHLGAQDHSVSISWYQRVADLRVSTTDPDASLFLTKNGSHLGYQTHYVVDGGKSRIILNVLVAPSEVSENKPMLDLLWRETLLLEIVAQASQRRAQVRHRGEPGRHREPAHPCLHSLTR